MIVRVLPLPAPANTSSGPSPWVTACIWGSFSVVIGQPSLTLPPVTHKTRAHATELLYAHAMRAWSCALRPVLAGVSVALPPGTAILPEECACCAEPATHRLAARRRDGVSVLVGYCEECAEHQAAASSRVLSLALSSLLLGIVTAGGLPLLAPRLGLFGLALCACVASLLPLGLLLLPHGHAGSAHAARGPAVFWTRGDRLLCASERYGRRIGELN